MGLGPKVPLLSRLIAVYSDAQEQVLEDIPKAIEWLAAASFMLHLCKSQLVQATAQVLTHLWTSGGLWMPNITKLTTLMEKSDGDLAWLNWASLHKLLSFYREYIPAKLVELLHYLLGQDTQLWMAAAGEYICKVAWCIITVLSWHNSDLLAEPRVETRVPGMGISTLPLQ